MIKKIGLFLLSLFGVLGFGVSLANPIALPTYCYTFKNVEIDNYRVVIEYGKRDSNIINPYDVALFENSENWEVYEPKANECTKCRYWGGISNVYLLDKNINIGDITKENIDNKAILIGDIGNSDCTSYYDKKFINKIEKDGDIYLITHSKTKDMNKIRGIKNKLIEFPIVRFLTVLMETFILFVIAKIFREKDQISNKRILLFGVIPTTITLPLLWFVLPLILGDGIGYIVVGELLVIAIEAIIIKYGLKVQWKSAIIASVICNILSFFVLSDDYLTSDLRIGFFIPRFSVILIEVAILFISRKFWKEEGISNKKLILLGIFASTVTALFLCIGSALSDPEYYDIFTKYIFIVIRIVVQTLIFKHGLKISWKDAIISSIVCNLVSCVMLSVFSFDGSFLKVYHDGVPWMYDDIPNYIMDLLGL